MNKEEILFQLNLIDKLTEIEFSSIESYKEVCKDIRGYTRDIRKELLQ